MQDLNQAYRLLESKFLEDRNVLGKLIERLSYACKGQSLELDNKLAKLRSTLAENAELENAEPQITQLDALLHQHIQMRERQLTEAKNNFLTSCNLLQKARGLEPETRRQLRKLIDQVQQPETVLVHLLPFIGTLADMYGSTLKYIYEQKEIPLEEVQQHTLGQEQLAEELLKVLTDFEFDPATSARIEEQRQRLKKADSAMTLASICAELMRVILHAIQKERSGSEQFLARLNSSLERINKALFQSLDASTKLNELQQDTESQIRQHLAGLSELVDNGDKLDELKVQINDRLETISGLLEKRSDQSTLEAELQQSLAQMKERLSILEKEASQYQAQLNEQHQKLYIDSLTHIPNRASFDDRFESEFERAKHYQQPLTLAVLDIDHFKLINDNFGHMAGDKTLSALGRLLRKWIRQTDFVARYGGEEFVILFPGVTVNQAKPLLQKLCNNIAAVPFVYRGQSLKVTISIGAAQADFTQNRMELFELADKALYKAKNNGRNQVIVSE